MTVATGIYMEAYVSTTAGHKTLYKGYGNVKWDSQEGRYYWEVYLAHNGNSLNLNSQGYNFKDRKECTQDMMKHFSAMETVNVRK